MEGKISNRREFRSSNFFERFVAYQLGSMNNKIDQLNSLVKEMMASLNYHIPLTSDMPPGYEYYAEDIKLEGK